MQRHKMEQPMSFRTEGGDRNSPSNQPGIVWNKRSLATQCANPQCSKELLYLREGRLELLDLESHASDQLGPDDGAFSMRSVPSRLFWLCGVCTKTYVVKRWTPSGLVVGLRSHTGDSKPGLADRARYRNDPVTSAVLDEPLPGGSQASNARPGAYFFL
jgi:hypothetical protein